MPKLRKETIDGILELIKEGYRDVEIADKLGVTRQTAAKYRHQGDVKTHPLKLLETSDPGPSPLPSKVVKQLYDLQGVLGAESLEEAVDIAYKNLCTASKYMLKYEGVDTVEGVILRLEKELVNWAEAYDKIRQNRDEFQAMNVKLTNTFNDPTKGEIYGLLTKWGTSNVVRIAYSYLKQEKTIDPETSLLEFMDGSVWGLLEKYGFSCRETYNSDGEVKTQLILPNGQAIFFRESL